MKFILLIITFYELILNSSFFFPDPVRLVVLPRGRDNIAMTLYLLRVSLNLKLDLLSKQLDPKTSGQQEKQ